MEELKFSADARNSIFKGITKVHDAVKATYGVKGRNVIINSKDNPFITKDGVTVAKHVNLKDPYENIGANIIKNVALNTVKEVGDGTTTSIILANAIIKEGIVALNSGVNPYFLKKGIDIAVSKVCDYIKDNSINITNDIAKIKQVALVACNNDEYIANLIIEIIGKITKYSIIKIEESNSMDTTIDVIEGIELNRGFISPYFITNVDKNICELEETYILLCDCKLNISNENLDNILSIIYKENKSLLIVADDIEGEILSSLIINKVRNNIKVCAIKSPDFGNQKKNTLADLSIIVNGVIVSKELGIDLSNIDISMLGFAKKVVVYSNKIHIIGVEPNIVQLNTHISNLQNLLDSDIDTFEKEFITNRLSKLKGGVVHIKVGAISEFELKEKKDRIEDALYSTLSALEEGISVGGGISFINAITSLDNYVTNNNDVNEGVSIIKKVLYYPINILLENAGIDNSILKKPRMSDDYGYNLLTNNIENLVENGIIDSTKVLKISLLNASSIASMLLTTECVIL